MARRQRWGSLLPVSPWSSVSSLVPSCVEWLLLVPRIPAGKGGTGSCLPGAGHGWLPGCAGQVALKTSLSADVFIY